MKNLLRICAMLVICIILVNIISFPAKAIVTEGIIAKGAAEVIAAALIALGITYSPSTGIESWNAINSDALAYLNQQGYIATGSTINLWQAANGLFYVSTDMLLSLKDWLFDSDIVIPPFPYSIAESYVSVSDGRTVSVRGESPIYVYYFDGYTKYNKYYTYSAVFSASEFQVLNTSGSWVTITSQNNAGTYYTVGGVQWGENPTPVSLPYSRLPFEEFVSFYKNYSAGSRETSIPSGISLSDIPPLPGTTIETNYPEWAEKVIIIELPEDVPWPEDPEEPTEDPTEPTTPRPIPVIPINPNPFIPENPPTQEEVQNPEPDKVDDPNSNPDSGTDTDTGSNPDGSTGTGGATISNPSPDDLKVDLTDFFPFCIPFDIYEFFKILSAAPEAPEFDLKLYGFGQEFSFHVDLSPFDSLAALVRAFELMGFIIGLGILTRDKFLRG